MKIFLNYEQSLYVSCTENLACFSTFVQGNLKNYVMNFQCIPTCLHVHVHVHVAAPEADDSNCFACFLLLLNYNLQTCKIIL